MDGEEFKGSGIDKIACKPHDSSTVPRWYAEKKYAEIENYVRKDADEFIGVCSWLYKELRGLLAKFKSEDSVR